MSGIPACFGKSWEAKSTVCAGGLDPAYLHPEGGHKRDRCRYYGSCASRTTAANLQQERAQTISASTLVRQPPKIHDPFQGMLRNIQSGATQVAQRVGNIPVKPQTQILPSIPSMPTMPTAPQVAHTPQAPQGYVHPSMASVPHMVPVNHQMPGTQMPSYLTVPEPIIPGQGLGRPFAATVGRSIMKAVGHTIANWFDHVPWNPFPPYPPHQ